MKKFASALVIFLLSSVAIAQRADYKVSILPATGGNFTLVVISPDGAIQRMTGYNSDSRNLETAATWGRKLELALNSGAVKWADVTNHLLGRLVADAPRNGYAEPSTEKAFQVLQAQAITGYRVSIMPASGRDFRLAVLGPEGFTSQLGYNSDSENIKFAATWGRKLETALNRGVLKRGDFDYHLLRRFVSGAYIHDTTVRTYGIVKAQIVSGYTVDIAPGSEGDFRLLIVGPQGVKTQLGWNADSEKNVNRALLMGQKLETALNQRAVTWSEVTWELQARLIAPEPASGYVNPTTVKAFDKIQNFSPIKMGCEASFVRVN